MLFASLKRGSHPNLVYQLSHQTFVAGLSWPRKYHWVIDNWMWWLLEILYRDPESTQHFGCSNSSEPQLEHRRVSQSMHVAVKMAEFV